MAWQNKAYSITDAHVRSVNKNFRMVVTLNILQLQFKYTQNTLWPQHNDTTYYSEKSILQPSQCFPERRVLIGDTVANHIKML